MNFGDTVEWVGKGVDGAGVIVVIAGAAIATCVLLASVRSGDGFDAMYRAYRRSLGRAILLGLEFLVAGDIIRTVAVSPTFTSTGVLALIVVIRTLLSFSLELELSGRWPWQKKSEVDVAAAIDTGVPRAVARHGEPAT